MSSSFVTKQLLNDVEDMQAAFEIAKAVIDESISSLQTSVATKQDKITVLSDLTLKNVNLITMNNVSASSIAEAVEEIPSLWSYIMGQLPYKQDILTTNSNISIKTLNDMPVNDIISSVNDTTAVKKMLNDFYDDTQMTIAATTVNCTNLIVDNIPFAKLPQTHIILKTQYIKWTHDWKIEPGNESFYINKNYMLMYVRFVPIYTRSHFAFSFNAAYSFDTRTTGKIEIFGKVKQFAPNYFVPTNWDNIWHSGDNNKPTFDSTEVAIEKNPLFPFSFTMPSGKNISGLEIELQIWVNNRTTSPLYMNNDDSSTYWHITEIYDPPDSGIY